MTQPTVRRRITVVGVFAVFFLGDAAFVYEITRSGNTAGAGTLSVAGLVVGIVILAALWQFEWLGLLDRADRWAARILFAAGFLGGIVAIANYTNRAFPFGPPELKYFSVLSKEHILRGPKTPERWSLLLEVDGRRDWINADCDVWLNAAIGKRQAALVTTGRWGFKAIRPVVVSNQMQLENGA